MRKNQERLWEPASEGSGSRLEVLAFAKESHQLVQPSCPMPGEIRYSLCVCVREL